jgi:hypothetical protein
MNDNPGSSESAANLLLEIVKLTDGHSSETLKRTFQAVLMLRGETTGVANAIQPHSASNSTGDSEFADTKIGPKAVKWLQRNGISRLQLEEIFHVTGDRVDVTASGVPGAGKKEMTVNCYLLMGVRGLLQFDEPKLNESETLDLCKRLAAYDKNNHTTFRKNVGNRMTGEKPDFVLTGPGEKAAAELVKNMSEI